MARRAGRAEAPPQTAVRHLAGRGETPTVVARAATKYATAVACETPREEFTRSLRECSDVSRRAATRVLKQSAVAAEEWAEMLDMAMERLAHGGEEAKRFGGRLYGLIDGVLGRGHAARR